MTFAHHMGEQALAAAIVGGTAVVPVTLLVVRAKIERLSRALRRRRPC